MNGLIASATAILLTIGIIIYQDYKIDKLKTEAAAYENTISEYVKADEKNQTAIKECKDIAALNLAKAENARLKAEALSKQAEAINADFERVLEQLNVTPISIQGGCDAANDVEYIEFMCSGPLGCNDT